MKHTILFTAFAAIVRATVITCKVTLSNEDDSPFNVMIDSATLFDVKCYDKDTQSPSEEEVSVFCSVYKGYNVYEFPNFKLQPDKHGRTHINLPPGPVDLAYTGGSLTCAYYAGPHSHRRMFDFVVKLLPAEPPKNEEEAR